MVTMVMMITLMVMTGTKTKKIRGTKSKTKTNTKRNTKIKRKTNTKTKTKNITKTKKKEMRAQIRALLLKLGYSNRYHHL